MTRELFWLTLTVIFTGLLWIPYIINRCQVRGVSSAMANPSRNAKPHAEWATRLMFAHDNAAANLITFAPLLLRGAEIVGGGAVEFDIGRAEFAPAHRNEMRRKVHRYRRACSDADLLFDLGR